MGVFTVETKITNWQNRFLPEDERGDEVTCAALVDTGAVELALPAELIERLRLVQVGVIRAETADGAHRRYPPMGSPGQTRRAEEPHGGHRTPA